MPAAADRAALAFSAIPVTPAVAVSQRLSIAERVKLREGLARNRDATSDQRREALEALVAAVQAGTTFPPPLAHDEDTCPFHDFEQRPPADLVGTLGKFARSQPLLVAVALCHFTENYRDTIWTALDSDCRAAVRPTLGHVAQTSHSRTRRYAQELDGELARLDRRLGRA